MGKCREVQGSANMPQHKSRDDICLGNDRCIPSGICIPSSICIPCSEGYTRVMGGYIRTLTPVLSLVLHDYLSFQSIGYLSSSYSSALKTNS